MKAVSEATLMERVRAEGDGWVCINKQTWTKMIEGDGYKVEYSIHYIDYRFNWDCSVRSLDDRCNYYLGEVSVKPFGSFSEAFDYIEQFIKNSHVGFMADHMPKKWPINWNNLIKKEEFERTHITEEQENFIREKIGDMCFVGGEEKNKEIDEIIDYINEIKASCVFCVATG